MTVENTFKCPECGRDCKKKGEDFCEDCGFPVLRYRYEKRLQQERAEARKKESEKKEKLGNDRDPFFS